MQTTQCRLLLCARLLEPGFLGRLDKLDPVVVGVLDERDALHHASLGALLEGDAVGVKVGDGSRHIRHSDRDVAKAAAGVAVAVAVALELGVGLGAPVAVISPLKYACREKHVLAELDEAGQTKHKLVQLVLVGREDGAIGDVAHCAQSSIGRSATMGSQVARTKVVCELSGRHGQLKDQLHAKDVGVKRNALLGVRDTDHG